MKTLSAENADGYERRACFSSSQSLRKAQFSSPHAEEEEGEGEEEEGEEEEGEEEEGEGEEEEEGEERQSCFSTPTRNCLRTRSMYVL